MKRFTLVVFLVGLFSQIAHSQIILRGNIIDNESRKGVPFASIQIGKTSIGTACDEKGSFVLRIDPEYLNDSIKISCIGYSNTTRSINDFTQNSKEVFDIFLNPFTEFLDEVKITGTRKSAEDFVREAIIAIPQNYIQQPFNMEMYSKVAVQDTESTLGSLESLSMVYKVGYKTGAYWKTKILQRRVTGDIPKEFYTYDKNNPDIFPFGPGIDVGVDVIGIGYGSLTLENLKKYKYDYAGVSVFDQDTVVIIEYTRKHWFHGTIYIAANNLAILKHTGNSKKGWNKYRDVIYKQVNGFYFPYKMTTKCIPPHDNTLTVTDEIIIRTIDTVDVQTIEETELGIPLDIPYDDEFWETNYPKKEGNLILYPKIPFTIIYYLKKFS